MKAINIDKIPGHGIKVLKFSQSKYENNEEDMIGFSEPEDDEGLELMIN